MATLKDMKAKGMRALILDLSMNFGGLSESVRQLAGEFLNEGDTIESVRGRGGCLMGTHVVKGKGIFQQGRMAVLVSGFTHSAAELLAAASDGRQVARERLHLFLDSLTVQPSHWLLPAITLLLADAYRNHTGPMPIPTHTTGASSLTNKFIQT